MGIAIARSGQVIAALLRADPRDDRTTTADAMVTEMEITGANDIRGILLWRF